MKMFDAQQAMSFLVAQASHIESQVYQIQYPDIQYANLVPVDTSANEWASTITFYSSDKVGEAKFFHHEANDMPRAEVVKAKHQHDVSMAGIGYGYTLEELGSAMLVPGTNLTNDRAAAARRAYEEFMDRIVLRGDEAKSWTGLLNDGNVTSTTAASVDSSTLWTAKDADAILADINAVLTGVYVNSLTVEMADTVLLPVAAFTRLSTLRLGDTTMTAMQFVQANNVYTATTGQPLMIRAVRGLESAGAGGTGRMIAYRRDPSVLKVHLPMPHRFLPVWQTGPMRFDVPGIFRTGGLEIRRPGAVRYLDGILAAS
jgi:hypothetical protein